MVWAALSLWNHYVLLDNRRPLSETQKKIGQMILVGFNGVAPDDFGSRVASAQLADGTIGGVILLGRNIENSDQLDHLVDHLKASTDTTPFIAIDQEGGSVQRLRGIDDVPLYPGAVTLAENSNGCQGNSVYETYEAMAEKLWHFGINLNLGPVVDVNTNPNSPVIGQLGRSYSAKPAIVEQCAEDFVDAHRNAGILTSLKHFPGHGSAREDSHKRLPSIALSWQEEELEPFRYLARTGRADMIMLGHLVHPDFSDGPDMPASLSKKGVSAARHIAGHDTVLISDDLEMNAISDRLNPEDAAVRAIKAGNDMIIVSGYGRNDPGLGDRINKAIFRAVQNGEIPAVQIDQSYDRIAALKSRLGHRRAEFFALNEF
nr:glycoside hydrolase family 3 N-terminal domain-containing protein [Roseibium sp. RKSG952]